MSADREKRPIQAFAEVSVHLKISLTQPWSGEDKIQRVHDRGAEEARSKISTILQDQPHVQMVGTPTVTAVLVDQ